MIPPTSIDGTDITGATIDGTDVTEITVDGQTVFTAGIPPIIEDFEGGNTNDWVNYLGGSISVTSSSINGSAFSAEVFGADDYASGAYYTNSIPSTTLDEVTVECVFREETQFSGTDGLGPTLIDLSANKRAFVSYTSGFTSDFQLQLRPNGPQNNFSAGGDRRGINTVGRLTYDFVNDEFTGTLEETDGTNIATGTVQNNGFMTPEVAGMGIFRNSGRFDDWTVSYVEP